MPSNANYVRDYKQEAKTAKARGEAKSRTQTKKARRKAVEAGTAVKGKDMGHGKSFKNGGSKIVGPVNRHANRSAGGKSGSSAGKAAGARKGHASRRKG